MTPLHSSHAPGSNGIPSNLGEVPAQLPKANFAEVAGRIPDILATHAYSYACSRPGQAPELRAAPGSALQSNLNQLARPFSSPHFAALHYGDSPSSAARSVVFRSRCAFPEFLAPLPTTPALRQIPFGCGTNADSLVISSWFVKITSDLNKPLVLPAVVLLVPAVEPQEKPGG